MSTIRNRNRRRREAPRPAAVLATGLLVSLALVGLAFIALRAPGGLPGVPHRTLHASILDPGSLQPHSEVRIAGVRVGQVLDVKAGKDNRADVNLQLNNDLGDLPTDTRLRVRGAGLLGQRYVELVPGQAKTVLKDGADLRASDDALGFGAPDVLNTFDKETRGALGTTIRALGGGLLGRGQPLNDGTAVSPQVQRDFLTVTRAALQRPGAAARLVPALNAGVGALDGARTDLAALPDPAIAALSPFVDHRGAFEQTLQDLPGTLATARPSLDDGRQLVAAAADVVRAVNRTVPPAPAGLRAATRLLNGSHPALARASTLLDAARPAVPAALKLTGALNPVLTPLRQGLDRLSPVVATLGRYGCDLDNFAENWRSALGFGLPDPPGGQLASGDIGADQRFRVVPVLGFGALKNVTADPTATADVYPAPCAYSPTPGTVYP